MIVIRKAFKSAQILQIFGLICSGFFFTTSGFAQEVEPKKDEIDHIVLFKKFLSISTQPEKIEKLKDMDILRFERNADDGTIYYELKRKTDSRGSAMSSNSEPKIKNL